ncbi:MAG: hypothetical protein M1813_009229 [Trichoglossum hirsutum]|nr:MAG: hypothetical protein M1813_009229 [Trichoglossum hirsutum]
MDPLSIAASIITVLHATNAVISICYDYGAAVKKSPWELSRLTEEVKSLRNILEALEQLAKKSESSDSATDSQLPTLTLLCEPDTGPLAMCLTELEALEKKLCPPSWSGQVGSKRRALVQAFGWPLKERDTKKILENIGRYKATLNLAITADQATLTLSIQDKARMIHDTTQGMQENFAKLHQSFTSMRMDDQREKIHRWLSPPDPSFNHNEACKKRQAETGTWFVRSEQFADWKTNPNSFLWLHGIPGCGKTILTSTIVEDVLQHCHLGRTLAVAYFYFDFNDVEKRQHEKMICSLITHLSIQSASTPRALESLFSSCMNGQRRPTTGELLETLRQMVQTFDETFIILDALDECKKRQELLEDIEIFAEWKTERLHILVTSRREKDIEERIEPLIHDEGRICIQSTAVNHDIRAYTHERLQTDWGLRRWQKKPEVQQEIKETLVNKAGGMFRWAVCQLDALRNCLNLPMLRKALTSLPKTLDDTYARILCSIDEEHSENALKILQWLAYSARPLQIEEIAEVIAVDIEDNPRFDIERRFPEPRDILTICSSLVTIAVEEAGDDKRVEGQVRLAHFSVKEYLVSERIQIGPAHGYSIRETHANISIAETCLAYLLQFEYFNSVTSRTAEEYPLARYATRYWMQHARWAEKDTSTVHLLVMELFLSKRDAYVNWIRLSDPEKRWMAPDRTRSPKSIASPLYYVSLAGLVEPSKLLLEKGADVNAQGGDYGNALQAASAKGHDQIVQQLLEKGADINAQGGYYGNALQAASFEGHDQIVQQLLEKGVDINAQGGRYGNALQAASFEGHDQIVQQLLEKGVDINAQGGRYGNALQAASVKGHDQIVQQLLEKGADVNAQGGVYGNALLAASLEGYDQIVQQLLEKGADVNAQRAGRYGNALQAASVKGHDQIVQRLLENGADVNAKGGDYGNALHAASYRGHDHIVRRLESAIQSQQ